MYGPTGTPTPDLPENDYVSYFEVRQLLEDLYDNKKISEKLYELGMFVYGFYDKYYSEITVEFLKEYLELDGVSDFDVLIDILETITDHEVSYEYK